LLYGGSAIGGVVNVIDNRIARERAFDANGGVMGKAEVRAGGAANERSTGAMVETGTDKFAIHVDAFDRRTQNLKVPKNMSCESGVNSVKVCNSASNTKGGAIGGTLLFDRGYLGLSTSEYKSTYGTVAEEYVTIGMVRRHHALEGKLRDVGEWFQDVKFQGGYTNYSHTEYTSNVAGPIFTRKWFPARGYVRVAAGKQQSGCFRRREIYTFKPYTEHRVIYIPSAQNFMGAMERRCSYRAG
jgi:iron complex outermembrane recepter protein